MPAQKLDKHCLKILNMEPGIPTNNSHQQLMTDGGDEECDGGGGPQVDSNGVGLRSVTAKEWITVIILCFVNLINYMDRFTLAGILTDVQDHFKIGDDKAGLLQTVFVLSYMLFAPMFGYLGDRYSRRLIMASGVFLWSLTTLLGSFMDHYGWFIFFRALVGIGEASYSTIAPTIISDMFVKNLRSKMLAMFYFAIPVGSGLGYIVGSETAVIGGSWQWGLRVTPALGAVAVILILTAMQEPARGQSEGSGHLEAGAWTKDLSALCKNPSFMLSTGGFTCVAFVAGALAWFAPKFIHLGIQLQPGNEHVTINDVSFKFGLLAMFSGILGVPFGSFLAQRYRARYANVDPIICASGLLISTFLVFLALLFARDATAWCYLFVFLGQFFLNLNWSIVADMLLVRYPFVFFFCSLSFAFGVTSMLAGFAGLTLGVVLSTCLIKRYPRVDPIVCSLGLIVSAPLIAAAGLFANSNTVVCFVFMFFGQVALNLNWAIVADISLYVVIPTRRSTAEAFQILISHAFGDAGSPYLIGVISEALQIYLRSPSSIGFGDDQTLSSWNATTVTSLALQSSTFDVDDDALIKFRSLQYGLFLTCFVEVIGSIFFLITSFYIVRDKTKVEKIVQANEMNRPNNYYADDTTGDGDQRHNLMA